ncbi:methyltransferase [Fimbriiglobus ruber]|uniref:Methyltransferase n=1 Tax=Fimbriiglobus ruber TaxID=1908690 RepID=A0A225DHM5_9BACT|nr:methyltransferase [Fimbriiglobus ruber]OWK39184.1 Methyltransferase [Fimbriiglobus ruber]
MTSPDLDRATLRQLVLDTVLAPDFRRATFAGVPRGPGPCRWVRVAVRPVALRGERHLQISYFDAKKDVTKNVPVAEAAESLDEVLAAGFSRVHLSTAAEEIDAQLTKKGKILLGRRKSAAPVPEPSLAHDHVKNVPLPEGRADRLLEVMGVLTREGRVRPTMRAKYTQINEFLTHLAHSLDAAGLRGLDRPVEIVDCGCGSSYLTLAAHHYLNTVLGIPARITGVDVNEEVIRKSADRAAHLGADRPAFACGRIGAAGTPPPDIVLALHACDTASDDALAHAVAANARLILCVPCCHHALNDALRADGPARVLRPLLRHGILHQRTADLATDAFRALALRVVGYKTDVIEFVSPEHTARNLMIRAVRGAPVGEWSFVREYQEMRRFWGVTPYIEAALGESFRQLTADEAVETELPTVEALSE